MATRSRAGRTIGWGIMAFFSILVAIVAVSPYIVTPLDELDSFLRDSFVSQKLWVYLHIFGAMFALLLGPFQFIKKLRDNRPVIHRWMGRIYLIGVLIGGTAGVVIARRSPAGLTGIVGFTLLGTLWLYTGLRAYLTIRAGRVQEHKRWMIRNYALSFAAVTLRLTMGVLIGGYMAGAVPLVNLLGPDEERAIMEIYRLVPWFCWVPNIIVAQAMIDRLNKVKGTPKPVRA